MIALYWDQTFEFIQKGKGITENNCIPIGNIHFNHYERLTFDYYICQTCGTKSFLFRIFGNNFVFS